MAYIGLNVYLWGMADQDRFLTEFLHPFARDVRRNGEAEWFWFDRFDARGPHVFALFGIPAHQDVFLEDRLRSAVAAHLQEHPSATILSVDELASRHRGCRGVQLCEGDRLPELAENNSFVFFSHSASEYPFSLARNLVDPGELWHLLEEAVFWVLDRLQSHSDAAARTSIDWVASVDHQLRKAGIDAGQYWRYHLTTLIHSVKTRLEEDEQAVIAGLERAVGGRNHTLFSRVWSEIEIEGPRWPPLTRMEKIVLSARNGNGSFWNLQREIDHFTLKQLGLSHPLHVPLVLYAWHHNMRR